MGGRWDYGKKTGGSAVKDFAESEDAVGLYLSADRLFQENSHADVQKIVVGVSAIFKVDVDGQSNQLVLGEVIGKKKDIVTIEEYKFVLENESTQVAGASTVFLACRKDDAGNFLTRSTNRVIMGRAHHQIRINEVLDMS